jgi:hypothetical protein
MKTMLLHIYGSKAAPALGVYMEIVMPLVTVLPIGSKAKLKLGGNEGLITGRCEYLSQSPMVQFLVVDSNGAPHIEWYDENLVEAVDVSVVGEQENACKNPTTGV